MQLFFFFIPLVIIGFFQLIETIYINKSEAGIITLEEMAVNNATSSPHLSIIGAWVDQEIGRPGADSASKQRFIRLSSFIQHWHFFQDPAELYDFLDDNPKTQIFLIMSGKTAQTIVPAKHSWENIHSMYVFCGQVQEHRRLKDEFDKVKEVTNWEDDLYERIADNLSLLLINTGESYSRSQERGLARNNLDEALRLMRQVLHFDDNHGRVSKVNDLLEQLDAWNYS